MNRRKFIKALSGVAALAVPAGLAARGLTKRKDADQIHATDEYYKVSGVTQWHSEVPEHLTVEHLRSVVSRLEDNKVVTISSPQGEWESHYIAMGRPADSLLVSQKVARLKSTSVMPPRGRWSS